MPDLILVRLHPSQQTDPASFTSALQGLQITAFDLTVASPGQPVQIGTASGIATAGDLGVDLTTTQIIQHWLYYNADPSGPPVDVVQLESAATAVIVASPPAGHPEYPAASSYDLQLVISRNGQPIADPVIEYNVAVMSVAALPAEQSWFFGSSVLSASPAIPGAPASAGSYVTIPPAPPAGAQAPALVLSPDGTPPAFDDLKTAINDVLALDPGGTDLVTDTLANGQLDAAQCLQIAAEIIWNRAYYPPPAEPADYGLLYTSPEVVPNVDAQTEDSTRQKFEGDVIAYDATNGALSARLADYIYAASAAVLCEQSSAQAVIAGFPFPLIVGTAAPLDTEVELSPIAAGSFAVPAGYFYALATSLSSQITSDQRYQLAVYSLEAKTLQALTAAATAGVITSGITIGGFLQNPESFVTGVAPPEININQAARRLTSLGAISGSLPAVAVDPQVAALVTKWLGYGDVNATIDTGFWLLTAGPAATAANQADYLDLVLRVVTGNDQNLMTAITAATPAGLGISSVTQLAQTTSKTWQALFIASPALLPPFTAPGTTIERADAFIRYLQRFFTSPAEPIGTSLHSPDQPAALPLPGGDVFASFALNYAAEGGGTFAFGATWDETALAAAVIDTLPGDPAAQAWLTQALNAIQALQELTAFAPKELQFSLMEALYARGFTSRADVQRLSADNFKAALDGTIAYNDPYPAQIQGAAGGSTAAAPPTSGTGFVPVNPDGSLTDCVPPPWLSPFGPVAYLSEMLRASATSSCDQPEDPDVSQQIGTLIASRRGPLADLHASRANLELPLPAVDLVNESLEAMAAAVAPGDSGVIAGAVFDTDAAEVAGHPVEARDAAELLAAIPEHSSPAAAGESAAASAAYAALRTDFTAPDLPYDQPLDVDRSYLCELGTSRFDAMRRFRKDITEFVLDPAAADEPAGFQRQLWRYPVRLDSALEYLGISAAEYSLLYAQGLASEPGQGQLVLWQLYGYGAPQDGDPSWTEAVLSVPEFLRRTGLDYCELLDLQRCGYVPFSCTMSTGTTSIPNDSTTTPPPSAFPECEPCCPDSMRITFPGADDQRDPTGPLYQLAVLIRLWRRLRCTRSVPCGPPAGGLTFQELADIATVLGLFAGSAVNPDFPRQLAALLMLHDDLRLGPLSRPGSSAAAPAAGPGAPESPATAAGRVPLLALWVTPTPPDWPDAVSLLLDGIERHAIARYGREPRDAEYRKIITANLDPLSALAGFNPAAAADTWHALPTHTLRFAEVLGKIYASRFTAGEISFLFTTAPHLDGDDPYPLADENESVDDPLALPEATPPGGDGPHSLWALRRALLDVEVDEEAARSWSWPKIVATLRDHYGYAPPPGGDPLTVLAGHFFPGVLERAGQSVSPQHRRYLTSLAKIDTSPLMWTAEAGPFGYDATAQQLTAALPLRDEDVVRRLRDLRPLQQAERAAVQDLYFAPRAELAPFAAFFGDFGRAVDWLVQEPDEAARFAFFQREFAIFDRRCERIASHLASHVDAVTGGGHPGAERSDGERSGDRRPDGERRDDGRPGHAAAWRVLRGLLADGNLALGPWEADSGQRPAVTWTPPPSGGAFAALLGLTGTGLLGEYRTAGGGLVWRETRGPLDGFGRARDEHNAPVPTVLPALNATLTQDQLRFAGIRNGFALGDRDGEPLGGAQPFGVRWTGELLIEHPGRYRFHGEARCEDEDAGQGEHLRITLRHGQKIWTADRDSLSLHRGVYEITVELRQPEPRIDRREDVCPARTGFRVLYEGPDTEGERLAIPMERLYRSSGDAALGAGIVGPPDTDSDTAATTGPATAAASAAASAADADAVLLDPGGSAAAYLDGQYVSSLRDIRRTYQRAFKALLFAERFRLSAREIPSYHQSELGYLLDNQKTFAGTSYYRTGPSAFGTHYAWFDPDLLPVADPYLPQPAGDERANPSPPRQSALFDWWERIFDYCLLRAETEHVRQRPAWLLFAEVSEQEPDNPAELLRHLGVDLIDAPLVLTYFDTPEYQLSSSDLQDERWAVRAWRAAEWLGRLADHFTVPDMSDARPDLWAADDPGALLGAPPLSGKANLTAFVQRGSFRNGQPRRHEQLQRLNNRLRERARAALVSYLCGPGRVPLPWGTPATAQQPRDLSDLLLQDIGAGIDQRMSRIEDATRSVTAFVQRARLGLEPGFTVTPEFARLWDRRFATYRTWEACRRREVYLENWIGWDDLRAARRIEAFRFLEDQLRGDTLSIAVPGGAAWWPDAQLPAHPALEVLQDREPSAIQLMAAPVEGLGQLGTPQYAGTPAWLAPVPGGGVPGGNTPQATQGNAPAATPRKATRRTKAAKAATADAAAATMATNLATSGAPGGAAAAPLPLWLQAAAGIGTQFIRVAAAGFPPASAGFTPHGGQAPCCAECGGDHPPCVDEYYFWLTPSEFFLDTDVTQEADATSQASGAPALPPDASSGWEDPSQLPGMLVWAPEQMVHLSWCRVHNDQFEPPRRSTDGLPVNGLPLLVLVGRNYDSVSFTVSGGTRPFGYSDPAPPGFRYDLATDSAVPLPLVAPISPAPPAPDFYGLTAYPYFAYLTPGAVIEPLWPSSAAFAVAGALRTHCQFEAALKWYELAYPPLTSDDTWAQCDQVRDDAEQASAGQDVACCPAAPVTPAVARQRAVLLAYLETLLQWGDATACRNSPEAGQQAEVIFETLDRILGRRPVTALARDDTGPAMSLSAFTPRPAALNPRLNALYERAADRLALIRHRLNGKRLRPAMQLRDTPYWDRSPLRDGWREIGAPCEGEPCEAGICHEDECLCCCSPYRFMFLIQKAIEVAHEVSALGSALAQAYERGDAAVLEALRAAHERQLAELALATKQYAWREADWQVQALDMSKQGAQARLRYYQQLLAAGLIAGETAYQALTGVAIGDHSSANITEAIGQAMEYIPDIAAGVAGLGPYLSTQMPIGSKLAGTFSAVARIINTEAEMATTNGSLELTQAGWDRRVADWQLQVETIGIEIDQIQLQSLAAQRHRDMALRDLNEQQQQIEHAVEVQDFLRDKFTSSELYLYLRQETAALHRRMYDLALHTARQAQRAYNYERGHTARRFLPESGWDDLQAGLLAGERLHLALRQMEGAYLDLNCREYELTKHLSLRLDFPLAYLHLQQAGWTEIEIPEWMFDLDYPGQYLRRIKNVSLTIPCVVGPYTGVHCRLTLLSSATRVDPRLADPLQRCCDERRDQAGGRADGCGCGCEADQPQDGYLARPADPRIVRDYAAAEAIATSSGQNDSGTFELNFRDERYLPFEFAGAVSRWRIELPPENNRFDLDTVSDLVLHLNYTAREGGDVLRRAAGEDAQRHLPGDGIRLLDIRHDLPDEWAGLTHPAPARWPSLRLRLGREHFSYLPRDREVQITRTHVFFELDDPGGRASHTVRFVTEHAEHGPGGECRCQGQDIECVASPEWPQLYHGVLDRTLPPLGRGGPRDLGELCFAAGTRGIRRMFIGCRYEARCGGRFSGVPSFGRPVLSQSDRVQQQW